MGRPIITVGSAAGARCATITFTAISGCAFCQAKKGFPGWAIALIVIAVLAIGAAVAFLLTSSPAIIPPPAASHPQPAPAATTTYYSLSTSVSPSGSGSISPGGGTYSDGTTVSLTAQPASGYVFDHWGGNASGSSSSTSVHMNSNRTVIAYFTKSPGPTADTTPLALTELSFTLSLEPNQEWAAHTIPIYIRSSQTLHLDWQITNAPEDKAFLWIAFKTPNGHRVGMREDGGFNDYWPDAPSCSQLWEQGNITFSPSVVFDISEHDWGEGYYYFEPHISMGGPISVEVRYWLED